MASQGLGHLLRGRTDVNQNRGLVGDQASGRLADRLLGVLRDQASGVVPDVFDRRPDDGAAMDAVQQAALAEIVQILADRLDRNAELSRQFLDADPPTLLGELQNLVLSFDQDDLSGKMISRARLESSGIGRRTGAAADETPSRSDPQ